MPFTKALVLVNQPVLSAPPGGAFDMVAIAASAGGVEALCSLLSAVPRDFPAAIVIVQHLPSAHQYRSALCQILHRHSNLPVKWAEHGEALQLGTIYLAPQDHHTTITGQRTFHLDDGPKVNGSRPSADPLFASVADHFGARAIGVVLTGTLYDGAEGARRIVQAGGRVLTQDKASCFQFGMPEAAIRTGSVDFVLPLSMIAHALIVLVMVTGGAKWFQVGKDHALHARRSEINIG